MLALYFRWPDLSVPSQSKYVIVLHSDLLSRVVHLWWATHFFMMSIPEGELLKI